MSDYAPASEALSNLARRLGVGMIVALAALRATVTPEIMPWFDSDPFSPLAIPLTGPGPAGMLLMDVLTLVGATLALWAEVRAGRRIAWWMLAALFAGAGAVLWHALPGPALDQLRIGATWLAAMTGAVALAHASRDASTRRLAAGVILGLVALLVARSLLEYTVEHDRTVANFNANRQAFLESRGWTEDSPMARAFERRLRQREASGWFGLTNVHATVLAGLTVALLGLAAAGLRATRGPRPALAAGWPGVVALGALAGAAGLFMTHSRGGLLASLLGLAALGAGAIATRRAGLSRFGGPLALALVAAGVGAVLVRAAIGMRIGELSLLFRWFYFRTATLIFAEDPIAGVGPSGFQAAYQLRKPPVSPEDISLPHNLLLAFAATLGVGGLAWGALWLAGVWRAGRLLAASGGASEEPPPARPDLWFVLLACAGPTLIGAWLEQPAMTPELALVRVVGLLGWIGVAWGVVIVARAAGGLSLAAAAGALAAAAQCMIDMGGTFQASACLTLALLGVAAVTPDRPVVSSRVALAGPAGVGALALIFGALLVPVWRWERHVVGAGRAAYAAAQLTARVDEALQQQSIGAADAALTALGNAVGLPPARDTAELEDQFHLLHRQQAAEAARRLQAAAAALGAPHEATQRALSQTLMGLAITRRALGETQEAAAAAIAAEAAARAGAEAADTASAWSWLAVVRDRAADALSDAGLRQGAIAALERAAELNPHNAALAFRLMTAYDDARNESEARRWAKQTLRLDELSRLDPEGAGLTDSQRERATRVAGSP
ncbi:MAG: O-antigen ligase family protein [Phycisphaerales bacterium JB039]